MSGRVELSAARRSAWRAQSGLGGSQTLFGLRGH